jgi:hypothetical protein
MAVSAATHWKAVNKERVVFALGSPLHSQSIKATEHDGPSPWDAALDAGGHQPQRKLSKRRRRDSSQLSYALITANTDGAANPSRKSIVNSIGPDEKASMAPGDRARLHLGAFRRAVRVVVIVNRFADILLDAESSMQEHGELEEATVTVQAAARMFLKRRELRLLVAQGMEAGAAGMLQAAVGGFVTTTVKSTETRPSTRGLDDSGQQQQPRGVLDRMANSSAGESPKRKLSLATANFKLWVAGISIRGETKTKHSLARSLKRRQWVERLPKVRVQHFQQLAAATAPAPDCVTAPRVNARALLVPIPSCAPPSSPRSGARKKLRERASARVRQLAAARQGAQAAAAAPEGDPREVISWGWGEVSAAQPTMCPRAPAGSSAVKLPARPAAPSASPRRRLRPRRLLPSSARRAARPRPPARQRPRAGTANPSPRAKWQDPAALGLPSGY